MSIFVTKIVVLSLLLVVVAYFVGATSVEERKINAKLASASRNIDKHRPTDRVQTKREKRKEKWARKEMFWIEQEKKRIVKRRLALILALCVLFVWICIAILTSRMYYAFLYAGAVLLAGDIVYHLATKRWSRAETTKCVIAAIMLLSLTSIAPVENGTAYVTADELEGTLLNTGSDTVSGVAESRGPAMDARATDEVVPENNTAVDLAKEILNNTDEYYSKNNSFFEQYTDEFGLDLDKMLGEYGYAFSEYRTDGPGGGQLAVKDVEATEAYWIAFVNVYSGAVIIFHSNGAFIGCHTPDVEYMIHPESYDAPDINVCLNEAESYLNRSALALLAEFLSTQEKVPVSFGMNPEKI